MKLSKHEIVIAHTLREAGATLTPAVARVLGVRAMLPRPAEDDLEPDPEAETEEQAAERFARSCDDAYEAQREAGLR